MRAHHRAVIAPHEEHIQERLHAERARHAHTLFHGGTEGMLTGFGLGTGVFGRLSDNVPEVPGTESELAAQYLDRSPDRRDRHRCR